MMLIADIEKGTEQSKKFEEHGQKGFRAGTQKAALPF